ncbi:hypothetical protein PI124_g15739 [Phytophthora idaei]|nr:hypothetical protein PI125_g15876 [Phytophthora idaei]KAG3143173.1 hypothetical protein PI126_g14752 [Phytophthora idaei]KAG3239320.1 hypothetical protein PI124_g15739 [Phytophthora idaei]
MFILVLFISYLLLFLTLSMAKRNRACSWISLMDSLSDTAQGGDSSLWSLLVRLSRSL